MSTPQKEAIIAGLREKVAAAKSVYLADYTGLTAGEMAVMRRKLREIEAEFKVAKNTLFNIAFKGSEYEGLTEEIAGQNGIAFGYGDPAAPAKVLNDTSKEIKKLEVKRIGYENEVYDSTFLEKLAGLPTRDVQLQIVLGTMLAPISAFARVVNAIKEKMEEENN